MWHTASDQAVLLAAHRGGAGLAPENTLAAFRNGIALGADFLELDAHLTRDGVPVVIHDPTVDRTTDGAGRVSGFSVAELQSFNAAAKFAGGWAERQTIPTFAQVLDLVKPTSLGVEIEIKATADGLRYAGIEQKVIDEIAAHDMLERVMILSFEFDTLVRTKTIHAQIPTFALLSYGFLGSKELYRPADALDHLAAFGIAGIGVNKDLLTPELMQEAQRRKMMVGVWTVDTVEDTKKVIELGVDSITSNRPDILRPVLRRAA